LIDRRRRHRRGTAAPQYFTEGLPPATRQPRPQQPILQIAKLVVRMTVGSLEERLP